MFLHLCDVILWYLVNLFVMFIYLRYWFLNVGPDRKAHYIFCTNRE